MIPRGFTGKNVKVYLIDGSIFSGVISYYTSALDNEPYPESITIGYTKLFESEINRIELSNNQ